MGLFRDPKAAEKNHEGTVDWRQTCHDALQPIILWGAADSVTNGRRFARRTPCESTPAPTRHDSSFQASLASAKGSSITRIAQRQIDRSNRSTTPIDSRTTTTKARFRSPSSSSASTANLPILQRCFSGIRASGASEPTRLLSETSQSQPLAQAPLRKHRQHNNPPRHPNSSVSTRFSGSRNRANCSTSWFDDSGFNRLSRRRWRRRTRRRRSGFPTPHRRKPRPRNQKPLRLFSRD